MYRDTDQLSMLNTIQNTEIETAVCSKIYMFFDSHSVYRQTATLKLLLESGADLYAINNVRYFKII